MMSRDDIVSPRDSVSAAAQVPAGGQQRRSWRPSCPNRGIPDKTKWAVVTAAAGPAAAASAEKPIVMLTLRVTADYDADVAGVVLAGEGVEVIEEDAELGMSCVRTVSGVGGWLQTERLKSADASTAKVLVSSVDWLR